MAAAVTDLMTMKKSSPIKPTSKIAASQLALQLGPGSALVLLAAANLLSIAPAQAETAPTSTQISFKSLSYRDYQSGADRINIDALAVQIDVPIAGEWNVSASAVHDVISGASPKYHSSALTPIEDSRNAYSFGIVRYFLHASISLGTSYSKERDYVSKSYSLQNTFSTENQNTTLTTGVSYSSDQILPNSVFLSEKKDKKVLDTAVGLTQVLSQTDIAQATFRHSRGRGYYSDQYKLFDSRPDSRDSDSLLLRWNHYFPDLGTTLRSSYRYYQDSFGIRSSTVELEYVFTLANDWQLTPLLRYYAQSAADFYIDPVANDPWADADTAGAPISVVYPLFSSGGVTSMDQRLSEFGAITWGLKIDKPIGRHWSIDFKYENYGQRAHWSPSRGSLGLEPFSAHTIKLGINYSF